MAFIPREIAKDVQSDIAGVLNVHDFDVAMQQKGSWEHPQGRLRCTPCAARGIAAAMIALTESTRARVATLGARCDPRRAGTQ